MKTMMVRRGLALYPLDGLAQAEIEALPERKPLKTTITRARSIPQHRLYFGMLKKVVENLDQDLTTDDLHEWMKLRCGCSKEVRQRNGEIVTVASSIAFENMDQIEFERFFRRAVEMITEHIIPGLGSAALEREARLMLERPDSFSSDRDPAAAKYRPGVAA